MIKAIIWFFVIWGLLYIFIRTAMKESEKLNIKKKDRVDPKLSIEEIK